MKKSLIFALVFFVFLAFVFLATTLISAVELTLTKDNYYTQETLQAEITGNFISLTSGNINIYKENIPRATPLISGLTKQGNKYYFYAVLPNQLGNYTLKIENVQYTELGELKSNTISKHFSIQALNQSDNETLLSINPGFIFTNKDFSVKVKSLSGNKQITATLEGTGEKKTAFLVEDAEETILFSISSLTQDSILKIEDYNIPIFIFKKTDTNISQSEIKIIPSELKAKVNSGKDYFFIIRLENSGDKDLTNITFKTDLNVIFAPLMINLNPGEKIDLNLTISIPSTKENISDNIFIDFDNKEQALSVFFEITQDSSEVNLTGTSITEKLSCLSQNGIICLDNQECDGKITPSSEGNICCLGICTEVKQSGSSTSLFVGIIIIIIVVLVLYYFLRKTKSGSIRSPRDILKRREEKYKERMQGEDSEEVSGKLEKI